MVRPNFIPRTKIGVGGVRLFDIPGVIYPDEMLHAKPGCDKKTGKSYKTPPAWGITSREAAQILGLSVSAARTALHKNKVKYRLVHDEQSRRLYWHKEMVEKLIEKRLPEMKKAPAGTISTHDATKVLGVSRTTLQRYYQKGKLRGFNVRFEHPQYGARVRTYFNLSEVKRIAARLEKQRRIEAEVRERMKAGA